MLRPFPRANLAIGLVDTLSTPRLLDLVAEGKLDTLPFATPQFPLGDTMSAYDTFSDAAKRHALKVVPAAEPLGDRLTTARKETLAGAA
jgi:threonine dehydrogenase-like Zn-dependent dehydrogenase